MIPKIIHYSWIGSEMPEDVEKQIDAWKKILPEWKFMLWTTENWNVKSYKFSQEMYSKKKWAYVTDVLRLDVLNKYGGVYLDTDMVIKKSLNGFLQNKLVLGFQYDNSVLTSLIMSEANNPFINLALQMYDDRVLHDIHSELYTQTNNPIITKVLKSKYPDFKLNGQYQELEKEVIIYPKEYFTYRGKDGKGNFAEHLFMNSWGNGQVGIRKTVKKLLKFFFPYWWVKVSSKNGALRAEKDGLHLDEKT